MVNPGWCVFFLHAGERQYLARLEQGAPSWTPNAQMAQLFEEYEARSCAQIVERVQADARVLYIPLSVRREWSDALVWIG